MAFDPAFTYDVFITHAWRFHDDWSRAGALLDEVEGFRWRNFSVPWHDPAMDPNTERGGRFLQDWLETQILPCHVFVFLDSVYAIRSARKWLDTELQVARAAGKPVIALPIEGSTGLAESVDIPRQAIVPWNGKALTDAIAAAARG